MKKRVLLLISVLLLFLVSISRTSAENSRGVIECPDGIENGEPEFRFGEYTKKNEDVTWVGKVTHPFFNSAVADPNKLTDVIKNGLSESLRKQGMSDAEVAKHVADVQQALFLNDGEGKDQMEILEMLKTSFRLKCCPVSGMNIGIGIKMMPDPRSSSARVLPKIPRVVAISVSGCPPEDSSDMESYPKIHSDILYACAKSLADKDEEFNSSDIKNLLVGCAVRIRTTAPVQTPETLHGNKKNMQP